jgi:hypothetical protein
LRAAWFHFQSGVPLPGEGHPHAERQGVGLIITRHPRARRYVLRVKADGSARVTMSATGHNRWSAIFCWEEFGVARAAATTLGRTSNSASGVARRHRYPLQRRAGEHRVGCHRHQSRLSSYGQRAGKSVDR